VRPLEAQDIPAVADMFQRMLRRKPVPPPAGLAHYMRGFYLDAPRYGDDIHSLVHLDGAGRVSGFIGVHVMPMTFNGRRLRAAICGSLMASDRGQDPLAGARLMKAFLDGPQDLSVSETANEIATQLWVRLRGEVLTPYSLDWVRIIRPARFALHPVAHRFGPARLLAPLADAADHVLRRRIVQGRMRWSALSSRGTGQKGLEAREIDAARFVRLLEPLTGQYPLRPDWAACGLDRMLADAREKPDLGDLVFMSVSTVSGKEVGAFAYYAKRGGIGRVLQVLARPGQAGPVLDCLVDDAAARGLSGLRGRTQPALMEAMLARRFAFLPVASTVAHSRDSEILRAMTGSRAFLNGLAGEQWSRLICGRFA
jgi:hypothetical protein